MNKEKKEELKKQAEDTLKKFENNDFGFYFFVMDTKGNPSAAIANIYEHVKVLNGLGIKATILHEKNDYTPVGAWLGPDYDSLPHVSIEGQQLKVTGNDFIIIPEIFGNVIEQTIQLPAKRIVMLQSYDYIFEMLAPGRGWLDYGITDCITTTVKQKEHIESIFGKNINTKIIPVSIPEYFKPSVKPKKPIIGIYTRDQRDTVKIFKQFYIKYPHLKWVSFKDFRGLPREVFAKNLAECAFVIWVDEISGFGTLPIEAMKCDVPVLGKIPNIVPEWMEDKNGLWTNNLISIVDIAANYFQAWIEDSEPEEIYTEMAKMKEKYTPEQQKEVISEVYNQIIKDRITFFEDQLMSIEAQEIITE